MQWGNLGWGMGFGWIYMLLFWAVVIVSIGLLVRSGSSMWGSGMPHEALPDILKHRYSKGEITREEYERMKEDLTKS